MTADNGGPPDGARGRGTSAGSVRSERPDQPWLRPGQQASKRPAEQTPGGLSDVQPKIRAVTAAPAAAAAADVEKDPDAQHSGARRGGSRPRPDGVVLQPEEERERPEEESGEQIIPLVATWNGNAVELVVRPTDTVSQLKGQLAGLTNVLPKRQKIMGLVKGKLPGDEVTLESLAIKAGQKIMMMGTPEADILDPDLLDLPEVLNDFDVDYAEAHESYVNDQKNERKLNETIEKTEIQLINPLREGKRLLVVDLDYTLFDCKSAANSFVELMRPGMHEFLAESYKYYDIVIWSQTSWKALELKVTELGILTHSEYKVAFVLDITSMFSVSGRKSDGTPYKHQVKPLDVIWRKFPGRFSPRNTVHVDDLSRNFAMNPKNGLKITAFKKAHLTRHTDRDLYPLARYLAHIALNVEDFTTLDHRKWKSAHRER